MAKFVIAFFDQFNGVMKQEIVLAENELEAFHSVFPWILDIDTTTEILEVLFNSDTPAGIIRID